jgi:hypothetical protein
MLYHVYFSWLNSSDVLVFFLAYKIKISMTDILLALFFFSNMQVNSILLAL